MSAPATEADGPGAVPRQSRRLPQLPRPVRLGRIVRAEFTIVAFCYLLAAVAVMALVWKDPSVRIVAGNPGDPDQSAWWLRYCAEAVSHWHLPAIITTGMNGPTGVNAMWNPSLLAPGVVLAPVTLTAGPQVSLNVLLTIGFAGSATSLYWVLRQWRVGLVAAVAGGLAYGFSPALAQSAIGHYDLQFAVFPPLIAHFLATLITGRGAPLRNGAALGLVAALQLLTAEELLFNTALGVAAGLVVAAVSKSRVVRGVSAEAVTGVLAGLCMAGGVFLAVAGYPLYVQFAGPLAQHGSPYLLDYYKNDLEGLIQPSRLMLVHTQRSASFADLYPGGPAEYLGYLGWPVLLVLAWAAGALWRVLAARVLAVTFLVMEALSLGGLLLYGGHVRDVKMPWYWVEQLPLASSAIVDRFSIIADGCAAALLALAIDAAWLSAAAVTGRRRLVQAMILLATAVTVVPLLPAPLPTASVAGVPAGWATVLTDLRLAPDNAVLTVPTATGAYTTPMRWQADTGLPASMVNGYFIGPVAGGEAYVGGYGPSDTARYLDELWMTSGTDGFSPAGLPTEDPGPAAAGARTWLTSAGISAVVAVTAPGSSLSAYLTQALGPPAAQSGAVMGWLVR